MDNNWLQRQILLFEENQSILSNAKVAIFGAGGVGSYAIEALGRNGINNIYICDKDIVDVTNINRQLVANLDTIGMDKVEVAKQRLLAIDKNKNVVTCKDTVSVNKVEYDFSDNNVQKLLNGFEPDYIIDCIDSLDAKVALATYCQQNKIKYISSLGAGNRKFAWKATISKLSKTYNDPFAKNFRKVCKKARLKDIVVCFSTEVPKKAKDPKTNASLVQVTSTFGTFISNYVILDLLGQL